MKNREIRDKRKQSIRTRDTFTLLLETFRFPRGLPQDGHGFTPPLLCLNDLHAESPLKVLTPLALRI
jgi:hypothetical protein